MLLIADIVLIFHFSIVIFIVSGLFLIPIGYKFNWIWVKNKKLRSRALQSGDSNERKAILISRNINKAQKILENVCKGIFTGNYADN